MIIISEVVMSDIPVIARGFVPIQVWLYHLHDLAVQNNSRVWVYIDWDKKWVKYQFLTNMEILDNRELLMLIPIPENWS
jgi:hypothetical protein